MKRLLLLSAALLLGCFAFAQSLGANLTGITVTSQGGEIYRVAGTYNDPTGVTSGTDLAVGDYLWTLGLNPGDTCRQMAITSIVSAFSGSVTFDVNAASQGAPTTQNSKLMRHTSTNLLPHVPAGGSESLRECISRYLSDRLDASGGGTDDQTATEVTFDPSTSSLSSTDVQAMGVELVTNQNVLDTRSAATVTLSGQADGATDYGTVFTGSTIPDGANNTSALQALETAIEAAGSGYAYYDLGNNAWAIADGSGVTFAKNPTTGEITYTIPDGVDLKGGGWLSPSSDGDGSNDFYLILDYTNVSTFNQSIQTVRRPFVDLNNGQSSPSRASPSFKSNTIQTAITSVGSGDVEILIDDAGTSFPNILFTFVLP